MKRGLWGKRVPNASQRLAVHDEVVAHPKAGQVEGDDERRAHHGYLDAVERAQLGRAEAHVGDEEVELPSGVLGQGLRYGGGLEGDEHAVAVVAVQFGETGEHLLHVDGSGTVDVVGRATSRPRRQRDQQGQRHHGQRRWPP